MMEILLRLFGLEDSKPIEYQLNMDTESARMLLERAAKEEGKAFFVKKFPLKFADDSNFTLTRMSNRNSWRRYLHATFLQKQGKLTLLGQFKVPRVVVGFTFVWMILVSLFCVGFFLDGMDQNSFFLLFLPLIGLLLPRLGNRMSRQDEKAVVDFLDKAFTGYVSKKTYES